MIRDRLYWTPSKNGWFSTASAIELVTKTNAMNPSPNNWIWKLDTFPKVRNFLWKIDTNGLPTKARLRAKHISTPTGCLMCFCTVEDSPHLMVTCPHTLNITRKINPKTEQVLRTYDITNKTPAAILTEIHQKLGKTEFTELAVIWWCLWLQRNKLAFQQIPNDFIPDLEKHINSQIEIWTKTKTWTDEEKEDGNNKHNTKRCSK